MSWHTAAVVAAAGLFMFDFQNLLSWWRGRTLGPTTATTDDYTIVIPVYGHPRYFDRTNLAHLKDRVLVAVNVTSRTMDEFAWQLEHEEGWRVHRAHIGDPSPPLLVASALPHVTTTLTVRMDADTIPLDDFGPYLQSMLNDGADLCSVKCEVANLDTTAARMQALEYRMAMLSRHFRPWLTSGACFAARTSSLKRILDVHTMHYLGEDIETGRIGLAYRMRLRHLDCSVATEAPASWPALFRQRRLWWAGAFRHSVVNLDRNALHMPMWSLYYIALVWCGVYFKTASLIGLLDPFVIVQSLAALFVIYALVTVIANWQVRCWRMLLFPPYALIQSILMPVVGSIYYAMLARRRRSLGRYRFGYRKVAVQP